MPPSKKKSPFLSKENILLTLGILIIVFEVVNSEALRHPFHYEFLVLGAALCGVGIAQLGDKR